TTAVATAPTCSRAASSATASTSQRMALPPSATIRRATSRPSPDAPPVTMAVLPAKRPEKTLMRAVPCRSREVVWSSFQLLENLRQDQRPGSFNEIPDLHLLADQERV